MYKHTELEKEAYNTIQYLISKRCGSEYAWAFFDGNTWVATNYKPKRKDSFIQLQNDCYFEHLHIGDWSQEEIAQFDKFQKVLHWADTVMELNYV